MKKLLKICAALSLSSAILVGQVFAQSESVLKYMVWSDSELGRERPMIAAFEAANPGMKVESSAMPPKDYWPRLSALAAAGISQMYFGCLQGSFSPGRQMARLTTLGTKLLESMKLIGTVGDLRGSSRWRSLFISKELGSPCSLLQYPNV